MQNGEPDPEVPSQTGGMLWRTGSVLAYGSIEVDGASLEDSKDTYSMKGRDVSVSGAKGKSTLVAAFVIISTLLAGCTVIHGWNSPATAGSFRIVFDIATDANGHSIIESDPTLVAQPSPSSDACKDCDFGRYSTETGADHISRCRPCPAGLFGDRRGLGTPCKGCDKGQFM